MQKQKSKKKASHIQSYTMSDIIYILSPDTNMKKIQYKPNAKVILGKK